MLDIQSHFLELLEIRYYNLLIEEIKKNIQIICDFEIINNYLFVYPKNFLARFAINRSYNCIELHGLVVPRLGIFCVEDKDCLSNYLSFIKTRIGG